MSIGNDNQCPLFLKDKINFDLNSERNRKRLCQMNQRRLFLNDFSDFNNENINIDLPHNIKINSWESNKIPIQKDTNDTQHQLYSESNNNSPEIIEYNTSDNMPIQTEVVVSDLECSFEGNETIDSNTNGSTQKRPGSTKSFIVLNNNLVTKAMCDKNNNTSSYLLALTGGNDTNNSNSCTNNNYYVDDIIKEENEISNTPSKTDCCTNLKGSSYNRINHKSINRKRKGKLKLISACHSPENYSIENNYNDNNIQCYQNKRKHLEQIKLTKKRLFQDSHNTKMHISLCDTMKNPIRKFNGFFKDKGINNTIEQEKPFTYNTLINSINCTSIEDRKKQGNITLSSHKQSKTYHVFESSSLLDSLIKIKTIKRAKKSNQHSLCSTFRNYVSSLNCSYNNCDVSFQKHIRCETEVSSQLSPSSHMFLNSFSSNSINLISSLSKLKYSSYSQYQSLLHFIKQHKYNLCLLLEEKTDIAIKISLIFKGLYTLDMKDKLMKMIYSGNSNCPRIISLEEIRKYYKYDSVRKTFFSYDKLIDSSLTINKIHGITLK